MAKYSVSYVYEIVDKYSKNLKKITDTTHKYTQSKRKALVAVEKFKRGMKKMALEALSSKVGIAALTASVVLFAKSSITTFLAYEKSMNKVSATTMASGEEMEKLAALAKELGKTTQFSASEAADAMTFLAMAGLSTNQIMKALPETLMLASAGALSLADAADISTNILSGMGLGVEELGRVNDVMAKTASSANTNILEMSGAMREAASSAVLTGVGLEEVSALVGKLADAGIKGSRAGTGLKNMFIKIPMASKKIQKTLKNAGVSLDDFVEKGKFTDFTGFVESLSKANVGAETFKDLVGLEAINSLSSLVNAERKTSGSIRNLKLNLDKAGGAAKEMASRNMAGLTGATAEFRSTYEGLQIAMMDNTMFSKFVTLAVRIGTAVTRAITPNGKLSKSLGDLGSAFYDAVEPLAKFMGYIGKEGVLRGFSKIIDVITLAVKSLTTGLTATIYALETIGALITAIVSGNFSSIGSILKNQLSDAKLEMQHIWDNPAANGNSMKHVMAGSIDVTASNAKINKSVFSANDKPIQSNMAGAR